MFSRPYTIHARNCICKRTASANYCCVLVWFIVVSIVEIASAVDVVPGADGVPNTDDTIVVFISFQI